VSGDGPAPAAAGLDGRNVLVVEDELIIALELADRLAEFGCTVVGPAATNHQALRLIGHAAIDLATVDVNLAGERSTPTATALRAAGVPFVVVTGYTINHLHERVLFEAPRLLKPIEPARLRRALLALL
jgi:CheY-like chemotaxis protein